MDESSSLKPNAQNIGPMLASFFPSIVASIAPLDAERSQGGRCDSVRYHRPRGDRDAAGSRHEGQERGDFEAPRRRAGSELAERVRVADHEE
jgi:hypothetical protein